MLVSDVQLTPAQYAELRERWEDRLGSIERAARYPSIIETSLETIEETRPVVLAPRDGQHCYDGEKCNADTFCNCPCRACMSLKRGEVSLR